MSELPPDCARYQELVELRIADEEAGDEAWMREHARGCDACAALRGALTVIAEPMQAPTVSRRQIEALVAQAEAPRTARWLSAAAVVLVVVAAAVAYSAWRVSPLVVVSGGVDVGDTVLVTTPSAVVKVGARVEATLTQGSRFAVTSARARDTKVRLDRGTARFSVRHDRNARVVVATAQCEVVDEGTVFVVDASADVTRIEVIEGEVEVRAGVRTKLRAGESLRVPEQPKTEQPRTEEPKTEKPKTEQPKTEKPRTEQPRTEPPTLASLLRTAQEARMRQSWKAAALAYRQALALHGSDPDAVIVLVSLAQIELTHLGEPQHALDHFSAYLTRNPRGALAAEAMAGTAAAYKALGRPADEARALRELIATFPSDTHAQTAKERLDALQGH